MPDNMPIPESQRENCRAGRTTKADRDAKIEHTSTHLATGIPDTTTLAPSGPGEHVSLGIYGREGPLLEAADERAHERHCCFSSVVMYQ